MKDKQDKTIKTTLQNSWKQVETEGKRILNSLGADLGNTDNSLGAVFTRIRAHNPNLKSFVTNFDTATYDARTKINWDAHMISAYAKVQFDKALTDVVKPKLETYKSTIESKTNALTDIVKPKFETYKSTLESKTNALTEVVKPKYESYKSTFESKTNALVEKAQSVTSRFSR